MKKLVITALFVCTSMQLIAMEKETLEHATSTTTDEVKIDEKRLQDFAREYNIDEKVLRDWALDAANIFVKKAPLEHSASTTKNTQ